jgi:uncharacterized membrane protein YbjE (DUF340 family)
MINSLLILGCFLAGVAGSALHLSPAFFLQASVIEITLFVLLFLVGVSVGANPATWDLVRRITVRMAFVPVLAVIGTLLGVGAASAFLPGLRLRDALAVGSGMGYYSLSSILITELRGETLGVLALLANILREIVTLVSAPLMARYFGRLGPVIAGGATATDTTLPIIVRTSGAEYAILAVFSGLVISLLVPFLIALLL